MNIGRIVGMVGMAVTALAAGCRPAPAPHADTGAREAARGFFEALSRQEWTQAYAALAPESKARSSLEQFSRLAQHYYHRYGLEPGGVRVGPCEEHGPEALAHVTLTGRVAAKHQRHKDAVVLRWDGTAWGVVLPAGFGRPAKPHG